MDPVALFTVTHACAVAAGLSTEQLDGIVDIGGYKYLQTTGGDSSGGRKKKRGNIYTFVTLTLLSTVILITNHLLADSISGASSMQHSNSCIRTFNLRWMYR
jgi:hypothetical protein